MALTAAIKFTQGPNTDAFGNAVFGTLTDGPVVCTCQVTGGVTGYIWTLIDQPAGSALTLGVFSTTASGSFGTPIVRGGYTVQLSVTNGDPDEDVVVVLCFVIKEASGRYIPGFRAPDRALTFGGQTRGWSPCIEEWLHYVDSIPVPAIVISGFGAIAPLVECSQTVVTPAFGASYTGGTVQTATLTNNANAESKNVSGTPTSFASSENYQKTTPNQQVVFTLNCQGVTGGAATPATCTITWGQKNFWGVSSAPANTEAFIEGLASNQLNTSRSSGFTVNASGANKIYFACPTRYGAATFTVGGFVGGFILRATGISVTNAQGFAETYDLYESVNSGLGSTNVTVS